MSKAQLLAEFQRVVGGCVARSARMPEDPVSRVLRAFPGSTIVPQAGFATWYLRSRKTSG